MPALVNRSHGDEAFRAARKLYRGPLLSLATPLPCPQPLKRPRLCAPSHVVFQLTAALPPQPPKRDSCSSLDALPDECLFEILRRLPGKDDRGAAACVSRRWLMLLSTIRACDIVAPAAREPAAGCRLPDLNEEPSAGQEDGGASIPELARCLEGKDATDARMAAAAITAGTQLIKLSVRSSAAAACPLTDAGLRAVARCCPSLRSLAVWDAPFIGDDGLAEVAEGCPLLEKLDLSHCPLVSDKGVAAVAGKCPNLKCVTFESCSRIGDASLAALGRSCLKLESVSVSGCPLVGDRGLCGMLSSSGSSSLTKVKLENLGITDVSLGALGYYGREVASLVLGGLQKVGERGFWVMGNAGGMRKLASFSVSACAGLTDLGLEAVMKSNPGMKQLSLRKCGGLTDDGLKSAAGAAAHLEGLRLEECGGVTLPGVLGALEKCCRIKALFLSKCPGIKETNNNGSCQPAPIVPRAGSIYCSLQSLSIRNCPGLTNTGMAALGRFCPRLQHLDLRGLPDLTDAGVLKLLEHCESGNAGTCAGLLKVSLSGCPGVTDSTVSSICTAHGGTLVALSLAGCAGVTDLSLFAVTHSCAALGELDVSGTAVSDNGIMALVSPSAKRLGLHTLSLARCAKVSAGSLVFLAGLGESVKGLNLLNCSMISPAAAAALAEKMWWCDILY